jgi:hypothetical protein
MPAASENLSARPGLTFTPDRALTRSSWAGVWTWKERLTAEEVERVRIETEPIWKEFYPDGDW